MGFFIAFLLFAFGIFFHKRAKTWTTPESIFCYLWSVISFLASIRLFGLNEVRIMTWCIILVGSISFIFGTRIKLTISKKSEYIRRKWVKPNEFLPHKIFWILYLIVIVLVARELQQTIDLMQQGYTLDLIRQARLGVQKVGGYIAEPTTMSYILNYVRGAIQTILIAVGIEYFFGDMKANRKYLIAALLLVIADAFSDGGRWGIAYAALELFVCYSIFKKKNSINQTIQISNKAKIILAVLLIILIIAMDKVTTSRLSGNYIEHFYLYVCGCVPLLNIKIGYINSLNIFTYIFSGQYGIWSLIIPLIQNMVNHNFTTYIDALNVIQSAQQYEYISMDQTYNAFVTGFYYLYADFRWVGIILGMLMFGIVAGKLYRSAINPNNTGSVTPYLIITQMILKNIQTYPLTSNIYVFTFLLLIIFFLIRYKKTFKFNHINN